MANRYEKYDSTQVYIIKTYFHWHECKEVCDKVVDSAYVKFILVEVFSSQNRFSKEQENIICNC